MKEGKETKPKNIVEVFERALQESGAEKYILRLYVTGSRLKSVRAITNIKQICGKHLRGRYELKVIDVYQRPSLIAREQIIALPALIKRHPPPLRRLIGDLSDTEKVLVGLDLRPRE